MRRSRDAMIHRAERYADDQMRNVGGDWGYRIVPDTLLPRRPVVMSIKLPTPTDAHAVPLRPVVKPTPKPTPKPKKRSQ